MNLYSYVLCIPTGAGTFETGLTGRHIINYKYASNFKHYMYFFSFLNIILFNDSNMTHVKLCKANFFDPGPYLYYTFFQVLFTNIYAHLYIDCQ